MDEEGRFHAYALNLEASLRNDLHALEARYPGTHERFAWFGIMSEDGVISSRMMRIWWQIEETEAAEQLERFREAGLVLPADSLLSAGQNYSGYHLPRICRELAWNLLTAEPEQGLGMASVEAHRLLLERYRNYATQQQNGEGGWAKLPEDGYIQQNLCEHMEKAERLEWMAALLQEETSKGQNAWYSVKERLGQLEGYREDVQRTWRVVQNESRRCQERGEPIRTLGLELRLCLLLTSVNSLDSYLPAELMGSLVRCGLWRPVAGLRYVQQHLEHDLWYLNQPAEILVAIAPYLEQKHLQEVLSVVVELGAHENLIQVFAGLLAHRPLPEQQTQILAEALAVVQEIYPPASRAFPLSKLAVRLPQGPEQTRLLSEVLAFAWKIKAGEHQAQLLEEIAAYLTAEQLHEALQIAKTIKDEVSRFVALVRLAPAWAEEPLQEFLFQVRQIQNPYLRSQLLTRLTTALAESGRVARALPIVGEITYPADRALALAHLLPFLPELEEQTRVLSEALSALEDPGMLDIFSPDWARSVLSASLTTIGKTAQALSVIRKIHYSDTRSKALKAFVVSLAAAGHKEQALVIAREIDFGNVYVEALTGIANYLTDTEEQGQVLSEALAFARKISDTSDRNKALTALSDYMTEDRSQEAPPPTPWEIGNITSRTQTRADFSRSLAASGRMDQALAIVQEIESSYLRSQALAAIVADLTEGQLQQAFAMTCAMEESYSQHAALTALAPYLTTTQLYATLAMARNMENGLHRAETLKGLAPHLTKEQLQEALAIVREMKENYSYPRALISLAPYLKEKALEEALIMAREVKDVYSYIQPLTSFAIAFAAGGQTARALSIAMEIQDVHHLGEALVGVACYLTEGELLEALALTREITEASVRAKILPSLAASLAAKGRVDQAFSVIREIVGTYWRGCALASLADYLTEDEMQKALTITREMADFPLHSGALAIPAGIYTEYGQAVASVLTSLAAHLTERQLQEALVITRDIVDTSSRAKSLTALAPYLAEEPLQEALRMAREIDGSYARVQALMGLATVLAGKGKTGEALALSQEIARFHFQTEDLAGIAAHLQQVSDQDFYAHWSSLLQVGVLKKRTTMQEIIAQLAPTLWRRGGTQVIADVKRALQDVGRWWP